MTEHKHEWEQVASFLTNTLGGYDNRGTYASLWQCKHCKTIKAGEVYGGTATPPKGE